jgi:hypothetical protein
MNKRLPFIICVTLLLALFPITASSQDIHEGNPLIEYFLKQMLTVSNDTISTDSLNSEVASIYANLLDSTESLNKVLATYLLPKAGIAFLGEVDLRFKTFQVDGEDGGAALGLNYSYARDVRRHLVRQKPSSSTGVSFSLNAEGDVSFDSEVNPQDFLDSKVSFHFFHSRGGVVDTSTVSPDHLNDLEDALVVIDDQKSLDNSPVWREFLAAVSRNLTTQYYVDFSLAAGLEANQNFTQKQYAYGAQLGVDIKAWNRNSSLANLNIFDWPFSVIRLFTGYDTELSPLGSTIPTIIVGIDQVDPTNDPQRVLVDDDSSYPRFRSELSFRTPISISANFSANVRYYREIGAAAAIEAANLDEFFYATTAITLSNGFFVSYTTGKLPFDATDDQVYELGFQYKFD